MVDTVAGDSEDLFMTMAGLIFLCGMFYLPLLLLVWRLNNRPVTRWEVWKFVLLLIFISVSPKVTPDGWWNWIR
jgi:hypothetical protein